jgi:hypothetical protein
MRVLIVLLVGVFTITSSAAQEIASNEEILTFINGNNIVIQEIQPLIFILLIFK